MYIVYTKHGPKLFHTSKKISTYYRLESFPRSSWLSDRKPGPYSYPLLPKKKLHLYWQ